MFAENRLTENFDEIRHFALKERSKVVSDAEWRFRMRGYGYNLRPTEAGYEVARLPHMSVIGHIDA
ncbi:hypothetical protein SAMN05421853_105188 [Roseivivax halotolerans]|jgi:hypothetical protein|uniref:Uncharacterized protein n=1 Tax=Roseivivax halotolerans TaxID=93684 RepID=A0A1I5YE32_9RHOB|nr:hypothetical protein [Roseivivax halotolerans]SFQ42494.1 hypothetical protein SAMN05421853_105188 [Roseivivax halotolerans]